LTSQVSDPIIGKAGDTDQYVARDTGATHFPQNAFQFQMGYADDIYWFSPFWFFPLNVAQLRGGSTAQGTRSSFLAGIPLPEALGMEEVAARGSEAAGCIGRWMVGYGFVADRTL
jgi:hypothetical protein